MLNPDSKDESGNTALHFVAKTNMVEVAKWLICSGFSVRLLNCNNQNPIDIARTSRQTKMCRMLEKRYALECITME